MNQTQAPTEMVELTTKVQHCIKVDLPAKRLSASIVEVKLNLLPSFKPGRKGAISRQGKPQLGLIMQVVSVGYIIDDLLYLGASSWNIQSKFEYGPAFVQETLAEEAVREIGEISPRLPFARYWLLHRLSIYTKYIKSIELKYLMTS